MTKEEIVQAISDDKMMPFIQPEQLSEIVNFVIKNYKLPFPSNLDDAAENRVTENGRFKITPFEKMRIDDIMFGAEWMAGQGIVGDAEVCKLTDRAWVTILDEKQFQNVLYDKFNAGDKVIVQIRKK